MPVLLINKKARFDYQILESFQAGLVMSGQMVKLVRSKKVNLQGLFVVWQNNRLEILNFGNEERRENIPLLLQRKEMYEIQGKLTEKGITCVVLNIKTVGRWLKAEIAVVKGKKTFDKRDEIKKRDISRDLAREWK
jgi:SsrA-binding protein